MVASMSAFSHPGTLAVSFGTIVKPTLSSRSAKLTSAVTVASTPGAIGYIDDGAVDGTVKVLFKF